MLCFNIHFNQLPRHSGCYVVTSISINSQDALDATLYQPCEATSKTLWMLRCNIRFNQFSRLLGSWDAMLQHPFQSTSKRLWMLCCNIPIQLNSQTLWMLHCYIHFRQLQDTLDATLYQPCEATSKMLWMQCCKIHFDQLPIRFGCYVVTSISFNFQDALDTTL